MENSMAMKTVYDGCTIEYDENNEKFWTKVDDRRVMSESLVKLKKRIDAIKHPKTKDGKPFERVEVWAKGHNNDGFVEATVTSSVKEQGHYRGATPMVWISFKDGRRAQMYANNVYARNEKNDARVAEIERMREEASQLDKKIQNLSSKMEEAKLPDVAEIET
jgi:hypothetical protein